MNDVPLSTFHEAIRATHGASAVLLHHDRVVEDFEGQRVWEGEVLVFALKDHPTAKLCYAWEVDGRVTAVLGEPGSGQVTRITNTILGRMQTSAPCNVCGGAGQMIDNRPSGADAQGLILSEETVSIKIPAGVVDGMQLKVSGKGNAAPGNGVSGDLLP